MQETQEMWVWPLGQEDPLKKEMQPIPVFLLENPKDREVWRAIVHGVARNWPRLSDLTQCSEQLGKLQRSDNKKVVTCHSFHVWICCFVEIFVPCSWEILPAILFSCYVLVQLGIRVVLGPNMPWEVFSFLFSKNDQPHFVQLPAPEIVSTLRGKQQESRFGSLHNLGPTVTTKKEPE